MAATQPSHRASLLAGLRTGGVRSVSIPHTAGPQASFVVPPPRAPNYPPSFAEEDEVDRLANMISPGIHISNLYNPPRTASCDVSAAPFPYQQQQWTGMQGHVSPQMVNEGQFIPGYGNQQDVQLQVMQMELMRLQALSQLREYTQYRHDNPQPAGQVPMPQTGHIPFQQVVGSGFPAQNGNYGHLPVPMTAAISGKFARRPSHSVGYEEEINSQTSRRFPSANLSHVNSNGTATLRAENATQNMAPSKSDTAISWRNNLNEPALTRENAPGQRRSPLLRKVRPEPLELGSVSDLVPDLALNMEAAESSNESSTSSKSDGEQVSSTPTTPVSGNSNGSLTAAREEASKKLFQGLGLGRPSIHITAPSDAPPSAHGGRAVSQPIRQPRGPPASGEELGTKNFANRIRKKAIGGLEALLEARERREGTPITGVH